MLPNTSLVKVLKPTFFTRLRSKFDTVFDMLLKSLFNFYDLKKSASFTFKKSIKRLFSSFPKFTGQLPNFRFTIVENVFKDKWEGLRHLGLKRSRMTISLIKTSLNYTFSKVSSINRPLTWDLKALYALDNKAWRDTFVIFC